MSLYGMMRTSVSGMSAQANRLTTISDNISNSDTTGYKRADTEFSTLVQDTGVSSYALGGVTTQVRNAISEQGTLVSTTSTSDLAISGNGFFVVTDKSGATFLTRAGSFVQDSSGKLINSAGFYLMGYTLSNGSPDVVANGLSGMDVVQASSTQLTTSPSTSGTFSANLPTTAAVVAPADLPSTNSATASYTQKTSLVGYGDLGDSVTLDIYMSKTGTNSWEMSVYNKADAAAGGGFPYSQSALATQTLTFDGTTGKLDAASPDTIGLTIPGGKPVTIDLSKMTQVASAYSVSAASMNGSAPAALDHVEVAQDGTVSSIFANGTRTAIYKVPLVNVASPDSLTPQPGNIYSLSVGSGDPLVGFAGDTGLGTIKSSSLEQSTVDIASELTSMIEAQRGYTANSKVFQTGAELLDVLVNLKS